MSDTFILSNRLIYIISIPIYKNRTFSYAETGYILKIK